MIKLRSPEADEFPPGHADGEPHDGVDRADDEAVAPPFALAHVACAEIDGDGAVAVVGERDGKVGEDAEGDRDHQGGGAAGRRDGDEGGIHGGDAGRHRSEAVVRVDVDERDDQEGGDPAHVRARDAVRNEGSGPLDEAGLGEGRGERHQPAHPEHRVPGALFGEDVLPGEDAGDEHDGDREHRDRRGAQTREAARGPEHEAHQEDEGEHEFVAGHRPHLLEFVTRDLTCIRNLPDFGRRNPEEDERHEEQADEARYDGGDRPLHSGELDADGARGQTHAERVAGHRGEEHYAGHGVGMEADLHQVLADATCGGVGFGVEGARERLDDRIEDAASSSGRGRRHGGRDDEFCETDRIAERRGAPADRLNDAKRNAAAEPHLDEAAREEEGA